MEEKTIELKLTSKEIEVIKKVLSKVVVEEMFEKTQPDYEEKVENDYDTYSKKHKEALVCKEILNIINYLER